MLTFATPSRSAARAAPIVHRRASPPSALQRSRSPGAAPCACGGGCPRCKSEPPIQAKLAISETGDRFEREADAVADQVMRMPDPIAQRQCAGCADASGPSPGDEEKPQIQRQANGEGSTGEVASDFASRLGAGAPLDAASRGYFEPRFGHDFGNVRIHNGPQAVAAAASVQARAFTLGRDVVFAAGEHDPASESGRRLLAHELTHVVQQSGSGATAPATMSSGSRSLQRAEGGAGAGSRAPRKTIWVNVGFDSSARSDEETMTKLRASIAVEKAAIRTCCTAHATACDVDVKTHYDWNRANKPAPSDGDYDADDAADQTLKDTNRANISGPAGGRKVLVTECTLSQTWEGVRIFPRASTGANGILWNRALAADDTLAHESGHAAGYAGDAEGGSHSSDPDNLMAGGDIRNAGAAPDADWCTKMAATAQ